eukprot:jgi/Mesen1/8298/ME000451S07502
MSLESAGFPTLANESAPGFWGPITSSTQWCEENYAFSPYVAEFFNTISNAFFLVLAGFGLWHSIKQGFERRFHYLYVSLVVVGIGSALFHATLQHVQQQSDETPMVWGMLLYMYVLFSPEWHYKYSMPTFLVLYGTLFAIIHSQLRFVVIFQLHYIFLCLLCAPRWVKYYYQTQDRRARSLAHWYLFVLVVGTGCWLADRHMCSSMRALPVNPQGHAWWHLFMSINSYLGIAFLQYCRGVQLNWKPEVRYCLGIPYIRIDKGEEKAKKEA